MQTINLFRTAAGEWIRNTDLLAALRQVGAADAKILFMHTELSFGMPNPDLGKRELLEALYLTLRELGVATLCVPTYTFSFCNGQAYSVQRSRSRMGALNEYLRGREEARRSHDPLLSVAMIGDDVDLISELSHFSIGAGSTFDKLRGKSGVKFLFFGARLSRCFTYLHYVEKMEQAPYRYDRAFTGTIETPAGLYEDTYTLFVRYQGVNPTNETKFEDLLFDSHALARVDCGDSTIACIDEPIAYQAIREKLAAEPYYFLDQPYPALPWCSEFAVKDMVTL